MSYICEMFTKGFNDKEIEILTECGRDAVITCSCRYRLRKYHVYYAVLFGGCELLYGKITPAYMRKYIITGAGQMERLIKRLEDKGLLVKHIPPNGRKGIYYTLSELGRNVRALYLETYRTRYKRLLKHIEKQNKE